MLCFDDIVLCFKNTVLCFDNSLLFSANTMLCLEKCLLCFKNCLLCLQIWATVGRGWVISGLLVDRFGSQFGTNTNLLGGVIGPIFTPNEYLN